ncbi:MAG TPA: hypothetical protein VJQ26_01070 [Ktedonobacteraceae bacterium]|nr:hypothetical protein [Ktedonobacteraceae bacterium]
MIANDVQQPNIHSPPVKSNALEEVSELVEEPDQRRQDMQVRHWRRNERIRLVIIGVALLALILSFLVFLFSGTVLPIFVTMVVVYLCYRCVDVYLDKSEASAR